MLAHGLEDVPMNQCLCCGSQSIDPDLTHFCSPDCEEEFTIANDPVNCDYCPSDYFG